MLNNKFFIKILPTLLTINTVFFLSNALVNAEEQSTKPTNSSEKRPAPPRRIPHNKVKPGGGLNFSRQACSEDNESLVALIPIKNPVFTTQPFPSFLFYIPDKATSIDRGEFWLLSADDKTSIYKTSVAFENTPGIVKIDLPSDPQYALEEGKSYHWYFKILCQDNFETSASLNIDGWVQRVPLTPTRKEMIEAGSTEIWYDSVVFIANGLINYPRSEEMQFLWLKLLQHIDLEHLKEAPIIETLKREQISTDPIKVNLLSPHCRQTFPENRNSLYYNRHLSRDEVHTILQSHAEGSSLRGVSRISGRAYGTVVSLVRDAAQKSQMVHNAEVEQVTTEEIIGDEMS